MRADYHLHSEFSDDSHAMMESQIERGIELGLDEMCFTDHVDYGIKQDWDDPGEIGWRGGDGIGTPRTSLEPLTNVHYPEYFAKLYRMRRMYAGKIAIKAGLEFGIQTHTIPRYEQLLKNYGDELDFVLRLYRSLGGTILTTGSDAHKPEYLADHFDDAEAILRELGFTEIYTFQKHQAIAHKL